MDARRTEETAELTQWLSRIYPKRWTRPEDNESESQSLLTILNRSRNLRLDPEDLRRHETPESLADWIVGNADRLYDPLVQLSAPGRVAGADRRPLIVCVHALSGYASPFRRLAKALEPLADVWAIQTRGLNPGETPFPDNQQLLERYLIAVESLARDRPIYMMGFSSGGVVAHSMSVELAERGYRVGTVFVVDTMLYAHSPAPPSYADFLTMMYSSIRPDISASDVSHFESMQVVDRLRTFLSGQIEDEARAASGQSMTDNELHRMGRVSYALHLRLREFKARHFFGKAVFIKSLDSMRWGSDFRLWNPPCDNLARESMNFIHVRMLTKPVALRKMVEIFTRHQTLDP